MPLTSGRWKMMLRNRSGRGWASVEKLFPANLSWPGLIAAVSALPGAMDRHAACLCKVAEYGKAHRVGVGFVSRVVRRCATLPHPVGCSTIAVPGLSFRVRNGSGRLPWAMAAASLQLSTRVGWLCGCSGTGGWTRRVCVFVTVDQVCGWSG